MDWFNMFSIEALIKSKRADWQADFSSDEGVKSQMYFVYFKISRQNQAEKMLSSRGARRFIQLFLSSLAEGSP